MKAIDSTGNNRHIVETARVDFLAQTEAWILPMPNGKFSKRCLWSHGARMARGDRHETRVLC